MAAGGYASSETHKTDCLGRIPYASLIALALSVTGVAVFCTLSYRAVNTTLQQMHASFQKTNVAWLDKVQLTFILVGVIMGVVALILLIVGALATGATRTQVYSGWKARLGGRISCAAFLVLTYILYVCWLLLFSITAALVAFYMLFSHLCDYPQIRSIAQLPKDKQVCVDFAVLSPILDSRLTNSDGSQHWGDLSHVLCNDQLTQFCVLADTARASYIVAYFACGVILLGLVHSMICLAANYVHIKDGFKYFELEEIRNEENEMTHYGTRGTGNFRM